MCTVVWDQQPGAPLRILALRDEFSARSFDLPGAWWPDQPTVVGGRDRVALGSWCVSDIATGVTALVVNRIERREGTPSRGVLPLAAVAAGPGWVDEIDHTAMASFTLLLAAPSGVTAWTWDARELTRVDVEPGRHLLTSSGIDADDPKTARFAPLFAEQDDWLEIVETCTPSDEPGSLVVRHEIEDRVYATVFGQLITATPGELAVRCSTTPWRPGTWTDLHWEA